MLNPERLELVRLRHGLTKIGFANELGVDRKTLQRFEKGDYDLPTASVDKLLAFSGYPEEFFEDKTSLEYPNPNGVSFRSLRSLTASSRNSAMAAGALAFVLDDFITSEYSVPRSNLTTEVKSVSPAKAALSLRADWGIGLRPIGNFLNLLEQHGIRVFSLTEGTRHLDAYSLWRNDKPYIFLNTLKTAERSRFDAAHELGHLLLHRHTGSSHASAESEADTFASAFLMPKEDLLAEIPRVRSLHDIIHKKRRWGVSAAALAYTLHKMGRITDWHYRSYCISLAKNGRDKEPNPMERESSQIWEKVLTDLWKRGIPLARLASKLHIPERELNSLLFGIATKESAPESARVNPPLRAVK
ncbi:XRE family transcriptional regulator [Aurantimonas sp. A3-2-R12]|uniref:XRE family transcriptional regulator n=1 Tax=Aurantimonas sp. A3-2-R12 TaxID=3114362 RepID=UPI002E196202|nr:XRE family transcriptional regulator [Aurantimonas sp. A3-2-R12]